MKYVLVICLLMNFFFPLLAISDQQNKYNIAYLDELDLKLIDAAELIVTFNKTANNMKGSIEGAEDYSRYLLDLTLDISSLRKMINDSLLLDNAQRENTILMMMDQLKPEAIEVKDQVDKSQDMENIKYLDDRLPKLQEQLNKFRSAIIKEESNIATYRKITARYLSLQNRHFVYMLLSCFAQDHHYLSHTNRQFLAELLQSIDLNIYNRKL